ECTMNNDDSKAWETRAAIDKLRKSGRLPEAVAAGEQAVSDHPNFAPIKSALAWALYDRDIKPLSDDQTSLGERRRAKETIDKIAGLVAPEPYSKFSPWPTAVLAFAKLLTDRWPTAALQVLDELAPGQLADDPHPDFPSARARWYLARSKALAG